MRKTITEKMINKRVAELDRRYDEFIEREKGFEAMVIRILIREYGFMTGCERYDDPVDGLVKIFDRVFGEEKDKE
jgi:hypothetical protein